jgi:hypothetical protein
LKTSTSGEGRERVGAERHRDPRRQELPDRRLPDAQALVAARAGHDGQASRLKAREVLVVEVDAVDRERPRGENAQAIQVLHRRQPLAPSRRVPGAALDQEVLERTRAVPQELQLLVALRDVDREHLAGRGRASTERLEQRPEVVCAAWGVRTAVSRPRAAATVGSDSIASRRAAA